MNPFHRMRRTGLAWPGAVLRGMCAVPAAWRDGDSAGRRTRTRHPTMAIMLASAKTKTTAHFMQQAAGDKRFKILEAHIKKSSTGRTR